MDIGLEGINIDSALLQKVQFSAPTYESSISLVTTEQRASLAWVLLIILIPLYNSPLFKHLTDIHISRKRMLNEF